jgi:hypothetical protein
MKEVTIDTTDNPHLATQNNISYGVHDFIYQFSKNDALKPFTLKVNFQTGNDVQKISLTYNQKFFLSRSKYFEVRAFAGKMLYMNASSRVDYRFRTSGWTGKNDYLYDYSYAGRSEDGGFAAAQFTEVDGAFKIYSSLGQTADWMAAINIKSPKLFKLPLLFYADFALCAKDGMVSAPIGFTAKEANYYEHYMYNAGLEIIIARDICEVFVPLIISRNIQDVNAFDPNRNDFVHQIRFTFNLNRVNPFVILKQALDF